jgi:hypothetical protein
MIRRGGQRREEKEGKEGSIVVEKDDRQMQREER